MQLDTKKTARLVLSAALVLGLGMLIRERVATTHATAWVAAGWAMTAWLLIRLGMASWRLAGKVRQHTRDAIDPASIDAAASASLPGWAQGIYAMEKRAYRYLWRVLTGAPLQPAGPFGVAGGPLGGKRTVSLLMSAVLCAGAIGYSLHHYLAGGYLVAAYAGVALAFFYALLWIIGERRSLKEGGHRIADGALLLDLGLRASASVPLRSIASCVAIGGRARRDHAWRLVPGEKPNVSMEVGDAFAAVVRGAPCQVDAGRVVLYVDDPTTFVAAVNKAMVNQRLSA